MVESLRTVARPPGCPPSVPNGRRENPDCHGIARIGHVGVRSGAPSRGERQPSLLRGARQQDQGVLSRRRA